MSWENLSKNPLLWICVAVFLVGGLGFVATEVVVDKVADRVIERLKQDYSPSPYGPGLDPDKVDNRALRAINQNGGESRIDYDRFDQPMQTKKNSWSGDWERERGFNQ